MPITRNTHGRLARPASFARGNDGVTTVEFALTAPVMLLLVMGIIEFSLISFTFSIMEGATSYTARYGKTGHTAPGSSRQEQIVANIRHLTGGMLSADQINITTKVYSAFDKVGDPEPFTDTNNNLSYDNGEPFSDINGNSQWDPDMGSVGLGNANDVVVYTVSYPWIINTPIINTIIGSPYNITVRTVVKNEPYNIINL